MNLSLTIYLKWSYLLDNFPFVVQNLDKATSIEPFINFLG